MEPSRYNRISEAIVFIYLVLISLLIVVFRGRIAGWQNLFRIHLLAIMVLIATVRFQAALPGNRILIVLRNWLPLPYIFFGYRMVHFLVNCGRNPGFLPDRDCLLIAADRFLFGCDPTVFLERITMPWLTEVMQLAYATNYFLPLILIAILYLKWERLPFQKSACLITLGYFLSYLGYYLVPAVGPRFTVAHSYALKGVFLQETLCRLIYFMEACPRDCFPSGHTEIPLITLWLAWRFRRGLFWIYLPIVILLIASTVYLRFHYVIDVIAGAALAGAVILIGAGWERKDASAKAERFRSDTLI